MKYVLLFLFFLSTQLALSQDIVFIWRSIPIMDYTIVLDSNINTLKNVSVKKLENKYELSPGTFQGAKSITLTIKDEVITGILFEYDTNYRFTGSVTNFEENEFKIRGTRRSIELNGITHNYVSWEDSETRFIITEEIGENHYRFYSKLEDL